MKRKLTRFICSFLLVFFAAEVKAQYLFNQFTAPYNELAAPADISFDTPEWDDDQYYIPLGFTFNAFGKSYDSLMVESNGSVALYNSITPFHNFFNSTDTFPVFIPFGEYISADGTLDLISRSEAGSPISYELTGVAGSRIAKMQWKNAGFYNDTTADSKDSVNFQIWFYEGNSDVEFRYGTGYMSRPSLNGEPGPTVGIARFLPSPGNKFVSRQVLKDTAIAAMVDTNYVQLKGVPPAGMVYRWTVAPISVKELSESRKLISVYPNPAEGDFTVSFWSEGLSTFMITDISGKIIYENNINSNTRTVHQCVNTALDPGIYFISIQTGNAAGFSKIVIK